MHEEQHHFFIIYENVLEIICSKILMRVPCPLKEKRLRVLKVMALQFASLLRHENFSLIK